MKTKPKWYCKEHSRQSHTIYFEGVKSGWEQWVLLTSDDHIDNAHSDLKLLAKHHQEAVERDAPIIKVGDLLCLMQGKWDKRADQNQLREEHRGNNYLDKVVSWATDFYEPYAKNIAIISPGNHELSITGKHQTDVIDRLIQGLNDRMGKNPPRTVHKGFYCGFVTFRFEGTTRFGAKRLFRHHGYGGGGEVTRGLIDHSRTRGQYEADIYFSGHIHRRNMEENILMRVNDYGGVDEVKQLFLRGGCYKDETDCTWHVSGGRAGRPKGGWWLRFYLKGKEIHYQAIAAD